MSHRSGKCKPELRAGPPTRRAARLLPAEGVAAAGVVVAFVAELATGGRAEGPAEKSSGRQWDKSNNSPLGPFIADGRYLDLLAALRWLRASQIERRRQCRPLTPATSDSDGAHSGSGEHFFVPHSFQSDQRVN